MEGWRSPPWENSGSCKKRAWPSPKSLTFLSCFLTTTWKHFWWIRYFISLINRHVISMFYHPNLGHQLDVNSNQIVIILHIGGLSCRDYCRVLSTFTFLSFIFITYLLHKFISNCTRFNSPFGAGFLSIQYLHFIYLAFTFLLYLLCLYFPPSHLFSQT